jgi:hypothetical protein
LFFTRLLFQHDLTLLSKRIYLQQQITFVL